MGVASKKSGFARIIDDVARRTWGFLPNRQVKPVHFANGFCRALWGRAGSVDLLVEAAGQVRKGNSRTSTEQFLVDAEGRYESRYGTLPIDAAKDLRTALDLVLGQDRALYGSARFASLTLTHAGHITSDSSDQGSGEFIARLLAAGSPDLVVTLRRVLGSTTDNVYMLTAPLIEEVTAADPPQLGDDMVERVKASAVLPSIQRAFVTLGQHETVLEKTMFLQRIVTLGSFGLFLHLVNSSRERGDTKVPLLLTAPGSPPEIREASRAAYASARQQIGMAFEDGLAEELRASGEDGFAPDEYRKLMREWLPDLGGETSEAKKQGKTWERFERDFSALLLVTDDPFDAFVRATVRAAFVAMAASGGEDPEGFATSIGRMIGIVFPRLQGRGDKYFSPAPQFLDMLVASLLQPGEVIPLEEFWERAFQEFGIVSGYAESLDARRLRAWGIRRAPPAQLGGNAQQLLGELIRMGHASEYADDIAMVRTGGRLG